MKFLKLFLKFILYIFLLLLAVFIFFRFFNATTTNYKCTGTIKETGYNQEVYVSLEEYLYSADGSPGFLEIEIPGKHYNNYKLKEVGVFYHLYHLDKFVGQISTLSNYLSVNLKPYGFFDGNCEEINLRD